MSLQSLLAPVFVQVALTFALLFSLGPMRVGALRRGETKLRDIALGQNAWPARITQVSRSFDNQFQLPVLFYVVAVLAILTRKIDPVIVSGAWVFVVSRVVHAAVHVTSNQVTQRFYAYLLGALVLAGLWIWLAIRVLGEG